MDPAKMKVVDLRSELGALGLDTKGNKPALVERLKKALESKTGKVLPDTSILDTSTEMDDEGTPRRAGPAARTRRRSSSSRLLATPAKQPRKESPESIEEVKDETDGRYSPQPDSDSNSMQEPLKAPSPVREPSPIKEQSPVKEPSPVKQHTPVKAVSPVRGVSPVKLVESPAKVVEDKPKEKEVKASDLYNIDDESQSPNPSENPADNEIKKDEEQNSAEQNEGEPAQAVEVKMETDAENQDGERRNERPRELTEEEEWEELNERLKIKEQERIEREKQQAEEDAKKLEELANDPIKLNRYKRKLEKKERWNNFYKSVEITNQVLTPPSEEDFNLKKGKKDATADTKPHEPEIDEFKIALSWYDSDLNQYLEEDLCGAVPLSEGAFAYAWAGVRATHGVNTGRVCYEIRVGAPITTTESIEKEGVISNGIRVGWSTEDSSLHLGDGEHSWGYETSGRAVHNGEFKEYGKKLEEKDVIGVYLDLESNPCKIFYTVNGAEQGTAFEFDKSGLEGKSLFPHILTKNQCYRVNFGYDRYNMMTKTKIVRNRVEIPVEQVLEEKRAREAELKRLKEEAQRKEKERREQEKQEREERNRKKKEEREKQEKERKEKEDQERRDHGEEEPDSQDKGDDGEKPQENGDKPDESLPEVKEEPMEAEQEPEEAPEAAEPAPVDPAPEEHKNDVKEELEGDITEVTEEQVLQGHILDKRIQFVIRYTVSEELDGAEALLVPGYVFIGHAALEPGPRPPASTAEAEVILMVGMPGSGKTYWAKKYSADNPQKRYNILSTGALFDKMKVDCKPFKATFEGRWDAFVSKCAKCVLKLLEMARGRRRNFILDQTNVYPSAQRRKLRDFDGYRRIAVAIVTDEETYRERCRRREEADGKEVPDPAIMDMKANFTLPEPCAYLDEVVFPELGEAEARKVIETFHKEARAAGVVRERERRDRSAARDQPPAKRARDDRRPPRDDRDRSRDFRDKDRWGGGGSRWGPPGGGRGSRWGGRDNRGGRDGPPGRFDRWAGPPRGGDFGNRDRDGFRGGRGGLGGPGGPPRGDRGPGGRGPGLGGPPRDFNRDNRGPPRGMPDRDKKPGPPPFQQGGGAGSWQRGGQMQNNRGGGNNQPRGKDGPGNPGPQNQMQQQQQGWNQWTGGWGGWGNWNQNQGWGNWGNWGNWNQGQNNAGQQSGQGQGGNKGQQNQQQWPGNYTAQQWYQWQQWQQQQQAWPGYGQQQQGGNQPTPQEAQQAWAQYYQNYGANAAAASTPAVTGSEKK